ncbi:MAG: DUF349 domain-containing protein [Oligoflexia bacterium]|nr:DUF349 domain-containing protein [Oligoflexia bacterium]
MKFKDLFTPRWKHSNPKERLSALKEIVSKDTLKEIILNDGALEVIKEALKRIDDYNFFTSWIDKIENHPYALEIQNYFENLTIKILSEKAPTLTKNEFESLLNKIKNNDKLLSLYKVFERNSSTTATTTAEFCQSILEHIHDEKIIFRFLKDVDFSSGLDALVNKINDGEVLKKLINSAKNKKIRRLATTRLEEKKEQYENLSAADIRKRLGDIITQVKSFISEKKWEEGYSEFSGFVSRWKRLDTNGKHPLKKEFDILANSLEENIGKYNLLISQMQEMLAIKERGEALDTEKLKELDISLLKEDELISWEGNLGTPIGYHRFTSNNSSSLSLSHSHSSPLPIKTSITSTKISPAPINEAEKILSLLNKILVEIKKLDMDWVDKKISLTNANKRLKDFESALDKIFTTNLDIKDEEDIINISFLKKELESIKSVLRENIDEALINFEERKKLEEQMQERAKQIVDEVENNTAVVKNLRPLQDEFEKIEKEINLNRELIKRFKIAADKYYNTIRKQKEDRHWEEWANYKYRKDLCEEIKNLTSNLNQEFIGNKVMELQAKWRDAGRVTKEQFEELNNEFKNCADLILKECSLKKEQVVIKLQDLLQILDESKEINFKELSEKVEAINQEWRSIGQIPQSLEKDAYLQFSQLKAKFFKRKEEFFQGRDKEREENLARKQSILAETERVVAEPYDKQTKIEKLKILRARWKEIGAIPRNITEDPWIKFKSLCDGFFGSLQEEKQALFAQKEQLISELQEILNTLDTVKLEDFEEKQQTIEKLQDSWDDLQIPSKELDNKFREMINIFHQQKNNKFEHLKKEQKKKIKVNGKRIISLINLSNLR